MYLLGRYIPYRNEDINSYINSYMDTLKKAELSASNCHMATFLKSEILIYNSEVSDRVNNQKRW